MEAYTSRDISVVQLLWTN